MDMAICDGKVLMVEKADRFQVRRWFFRVVSEDRVRRVELLGLDADCST
ncbi:hypothetical protein LINPERPRIM_LOCUS29727 [Linum perenne]